MKILPQLQDIPGIPQMKRTVLIIVYASFLLRLLPPIKHHTESSDSHLLIAFLRNHFLYQS